MNEADKNTGDAGRVNESGTPASRFGGLVTAVRTLTAVPFPGKDAARMTESLPWFPVAGLLLGLLVCVVVSLFNRLSGGTWLMGAAAAAIAAQAALTRGLHLDGLADWADGFWGSGDREKTLAIMKDSRIGTFGVVAIVCVLLGKWTAIFRILESGSCAWIIAAFVISRTAQVFLAVSFEYARKDGGTGAPFVDTSSRRPFWIAATVALVITFILCGFSLKAPLAILMAILGALALGRYSTGRIGGITGDIIGTCSELSELLVLAAGAVWT